MKMRQMKALKCAYMESVMPATASPEAVLAKRDSGLKQLFVSIMMQINI